MHLPWDTHSPAFPIKPSHHYLSLSGIWAHSSLTQGKRIGHRTILKENHIGVTDGNGFCFAIAVCTLYD
jgi:hypothetical protein